MYASYFLRDRDSRCLSRVFLGLQRLVKIYSPVNVAAVYWVSLSKEIQMSN